MPQPRLLDVMRDRIRVRHFSYQTEAVYLGWHDGLSDSMVVAILVI